MEYTNAERKLKYTHLGHGEHAYDDDDEDTEMVPVGIQHVAYRKPMQVSYSFFET